jgi:YbbR domain-containing protein
MSGFLQRAFVHNAGLKVVSLLLAGGLWVAVVRSPSAEVEVRVPIEFQNFPENLVIDSASPAEAQVRVSGPERAIHQLQASDVRAQINLATVVPGERTFDLADRIHLPPGLEVIQIIPGQFHLSFDERATRKIEVQPSVTGNFASGVHLGNVITEPSTVTINGPRHRVESIDAATTDPIDASRVLTRAVFVTHAYVNDPLIQVEHPTALRVTVIMEGSGDTKK